MKLFKSSRSQSKFVLSIHDDVIYGARAWQYKLSSFVSKGFRDSLYDSFARPKNQKFRYVITSLLKIFVITHVNIPNSFSEINYKLSTLCVSIWLRRPSPPWWWIQSTRSLRSFSLRFIFPDCESVNRHAFCIRIVKPFRCDDKEKICLSIFKLLIYIYSYPYRKFYDIAVDADLICNCS